MGRGDQKTTKGKRFRGTYGKTRQRTSNGTIVAPKKVEKAKEAPVAKAAPKAAAKKAPTKKASTKGDDLKKIEGVGPKAAEAMVNAGLDTFEKVSKAKAEKLSEILTEASSRLSHLVTTTWPKQAGLAADGKWDELKELQDRLDGGVEK